MKLTTRIGGEEIAFENQTDLITQLEKKLSELDEKLAGYDKLKKKRWFIAQALKQMKGESAQSKDAAPAKV